MKLTEAFRALNALNEDTFSVADDGISKLAEFEQNDDLADDISVIDPEAETEEDLQRMWDYIDSIDDDYLKQEVLDNYYRTHDYVNGQYIPEDVMSEEIEEYERRNDDEA